MWRKIVLLTLLVFLMGSILIRSAQAKEYPTKPIEILNPYTAGGPFDLTFRLVGEIAPKYLGQPMVVINKVGAGGSIAAAEIISSAPDGYKLAVLANIFFATTVKTQKIPFDPNDLTPIVNFIETKLVMAVRGDSPWKTFGDLLDYAKKNPGKLRWAHIGRGTSLHLNTLIMFKKAGIEAIEVPYKGAAEQVPALLGGHLDAVTFSYVAIKDLVKVGNVRCLIVYSDRRYSDPSGVPCVLELGFPEAAKLPTFVGLYAHKNTPEYIRRALYDAFEKTSNDPEFKKRFEKFGEELRFTGPEFLKKAIKEAEEVGAPMLKELGLYYTGK